MKKILIIFIFFIGTLYANVVNIAYKPKSESTALDERITEAILDSASKNGKKFTFNEGTFQRILSGLKSFISSDTKPQEKLSICQDLYRFEYDAEKKQIGTEILVETEKVLIDFDINTGTFTCLYKDIKNKDTGLAYTYLYTLTGYRDILNYFSGDGDLETTPDNIVPFSFFHEKYTPENISVLFHKDYYKYYSKSEVKKSLERINLNGSMSKIKEEHSNGYVDYVVSITQGKSGRIRESTVYGRAYQLGLSFSNPNAETNFTVSQFLSGLITLNDNVVEGVSSNGDIKINQDAESKMTILNSEESFWGGHSQKIYSFVDYFDKKIFGLYYNFMNIGWSSVFNYGGLLIVAMVFLYSGGIIGYKYMLFRINNSNENKEWDFPFANRITAIITMLVLSFLHYPVGEQEKITIGSGAITTQMETSGAKMAIGFLANIGATIADVASGAGITVYMDYLLNATNMRGYEDVVKSVQSQQRPIIELAVAQTFFNTACANGQHQDRYKKLGSFSSAKGHLDNSWSIKEWDTDNKEFFSGSGGVISPLLCKKIEKNMKIDETILDGMKKANEKMLSNLSSSGKKMADVYVDMQLVAARDLGWIISATLPISHIYMLNAGTINNVYDGLNRSTKGETTTIILKSMVRDEAEADNSSSETMEYIDESDEDNIISGLIKSATVPMVTMQIYNMLPAFSELRSSIQILSNGAIDTVVELAGLIVPAGKIFSIVNGLKNKITSKSKEHDIKSGMSIKKANDKAKQKGDSVFSGIQAVAVYFISFYVSIALYKILLGAIFATVVTLLAILKISLYFWD